MTDLYARAPNSATLSEYESPSAVPPSAWVAGQSYKVICMGQVAACSAVHRRDSSDRFTIL